MLGQCQLQMAAPGIGPSKMPVERWHLSWRLGAGMEHVPETKPAAAAASLSPPANETLLQGNTQHAKTMSVCFPCLSRVDHEIHCLYVFVCIYFVFTTHYYSLSFDVPRFIVQPPCATSDSWPGSNQPRATSWQSHQMDNLTADANILGCLQSVGGRCWTETASSTSMHQRFPRRQRQESAGDHWNSWRGQTTSTCWESDWTSSRLAVTMITQVSTQESCESCWWRWRGLWCDVTHVFKSMERSHSESRTFCVIQREKGMTGSGKSSSRMF